MAGVGPRGSKAARWSTEESAQGRELHTDERRLIRKGPAGVIFMCNSKTKQDCFLFKVLGLPLVKRDLVEQIVPGTFLFLFDIDVRQLHGVFEAVSHGGINLEPKAFQGQGSYPAQVRFALHRECLPLPEQVFKPVIQENYFAWNKFNHELAADQVSKLVQLFHPVEAPRKRLPIDSAAAALHEVGGHRLDLLGHRLPAAGGVEFANRMPQYRLPAPGIRLEEVPPRHELALRREAHPLVAEGIERRSLPQTRTLDGRPEQKNLLNQGRLEEVDQLALKYLQPGSSGAGRAFSSLQRTSALEARAAASSFQHEAILRSQALEVERLKRSAIEQALLRERGPLLRGASSSHVVSPFAAAHGRAEAMRQALDIGRRR